MKRTTWLSAGAILALIGILYASAIAAPQATTRKMADNHTFGGDSLGGASVDSKDTTDTYQLYQPGIQPGDEYKISICSNDSVSTIIEISPDGTNWYVYDALDTLADGGTEILTTADLYASHPKWYARVIFNVILADTITSAKATLDFIPN